MGMDFSALVKYKASSRCLEEGIGVLFSDLPTSIKAVGSLLDRKGFARLNISKPEWVDLRGNPTQQPGLPTLTAHLMLPEGFFITFGNDAICIYHQLRWLFFLTDPEWRRQMLAALLDFSKIFDATDGIVSNDWSPVFGAFFRGASYELALQEGKDNDSEVATLDGLYKVVEPDGTWDSQGYWRFLGRNNS